MTKNICDLRSGERFTMDDFPGVRIAWVIRTEGGMTRVTYKVDREGAKFDEFTRPALSTVYPA